MARERYATGKYAKAACALIDHLKAMGIVAAVGYEHGHRGRQLIAYVNKPADVDRVPKTFDDFTVVALVTPGARHTAAK